VSAWIAWVAGPLASAVLLWYATLVFSSRFDRRLPLAGDVPAELVAALCLGANLVVVVAWLTWLWRSRGDEG
jgi:hypothetical protein